MDNTRVPNQLPAFVTKNAPPFDPESWRLTISGLVKMPLGLSYTEILRLPSNQLTSDFTCVEGWTVKDIEWEGVGVKSIIELAEPKKLAPYVVFKAGEFTATLSIAEACRKETILAYRYRGEPLPFDHGAPLRLIWSSQECFESVKWVNHMELAAKRQEGTGKGIALRRLKE